MESHDMKGSTAAVIPLVMAAAVLLAAAGGGHCQDMGEWEMSRKELIKRLSAAGVRYKEIRPDREPRYENKIMSYVIAIDGNLKESIGILRTRTVPERDYLFIKERLYSVLEKYGIIPGEQVNAIIGQLQARYGKPQVRYEKATAIYSFDGSGTKVMLHSSTVHRSLDCQVYYYAGILFRRLVVE